jgi:hypothetical protein
LGTDYQLALAKALFIDAGIDAVTMLRQQRAMACSKSP